MCFEFMLTKYNKGYKYNYHQKQKSDPFYSPLIYSSIIIAWSMEINGFLFLQSVELAYRVCSCCYYPPSRMRFILLIRMAPSWTCTKYPKIIYLYYIRIEQRFYQISTPKYPLTISMQLTHLGRTSFTIVYSIGSPGNGTYATVKILGVFVDKKTRRPTSLPQWWKEKYSLIQSPSQPPNVYGLKRPECSISFPVSINYSDTDENCHTTWPFYMRMCYDAFVDGTMRKAYKRINDEDASRGVKTLELVFKKESLLGDDLNVHSWETDRHDVRELGFEITKGTEICVQAKMEFYKTMYDSSKM